MSKQRDDTPEEIDPSGAEEPAGQKPGGYYYDDSTGYEVYDPEKEEEEEEESEGRECAPHYDSESFPVVLAQTKSAPSAAYV